MIPSVYSGNGGQGFTPYIITVTAGEVNMVPISILYDIFVHILQYLNLHEYVIRGSFGWFFVKGLYG